MDFNYLVKNKRKACGLSLEKMSKVTNISEATLKKIEDGCALPSIENMLSICRALDTTPNEMLLNVSFDYQKGLRKCCGVRSAQHIKDVKSLSWDEKIQYVAFLKEKQENVYTALIQRKLGVNYREAKKLLEAVNVKE